LFHGVAKDDIKDSFVQAFQTVDVSGCEYLWRHSDVIRDIQREVDWRAKGSAKVNGVVTRGQRRKKQPVSVGHRWRDDAGDIDAERLVDIVGRREPETEGSGFRTIAEQVWDCASINSCMKLGGKPDRVSR